MEVFEKYIEKQSNYQALITTTPAPKLKNIVVIPCCNEPDLLKTINSVHNCIKPIYPVEIIVVINSSESADIEVVEQNSETKKILIEWCSKYNTELLKVHMILLENLPAKIAGVGYARKTGMDEAIRRFVMSKQANGIISCLDADSTVDKNYLVEIERLFLAKDNCNGCSIYFEHPIEGNEFSKEIYKRIIEYELYLRYYKLALQYIEFPFYHYTIGSSFAVDASIYCKQGGMNKKQAGEDFYFLQKIIPQGNYYALNSTCVYPSPRPSNRVPFGTGAFIKQYLDKPETSFVTYHFDAFLNLKIFFADMELLYRADNETINELSFKYHDSLKSFLLKNNYIEEINNINSSTSQISSFRKRFFQWFDAFKILKYLNYVHQEFYKKELVIKVLKSYHTHINQLNRIDLDEITLLKTLRIEEKTRIE